MDPAYNTGNMAEATGESGAVDNLISLDPNDDRWPEVKDWEDGQEYVFDKVRVRQVSPGQFEVLEATAGDLGDEAPGPAPAGSRVAEDAEAASGGAGNETPSYPNPAIEKMMR